MSPSRVRFDTDAAGAIWARMDTRPYAGVAISGSTERRWGQDGKEGVSAAPPDR